jgi:hypothetical protein
MEIIKMHDKNGVLLEVGDLVIVPCRVIEAQAHTEYCNLKLETVEPMHPSDRKDTLVVNTKQVYKVFETDDLYKGIK